VAKLKMMLDDLIFATPYLTRDEALEVFGEAASMHTTRLEAFAVEASARVGWEPLPATLRDGRGIMADGLVSGIQGGLTHADDPRSRPVSIRIRLLPPVESPIAAPREEPDPWEAFIPARLRAARQLARVAPSIPPKSALRRSTDGPAEAPRTRTEARTGPGNEGPRSGSGSAEP
jgi:hypothetical protein